MASGDDKDKHGAKPVAVQDATVNFGQPQNQTPDPAPVGAAVAHFLMPNDVTIRKGGTVTFVVNGGGHGSDRQAAVRRDEFDRGHGGHPARRAASF